MWDTLCINMNSKEAEETECILLYTLQFLPHLLFLLALLFYYILCKFIKCGKAENEKDERANNMRTQKSPNIRNWMYFYDLKLSLWVSTLLLAIGALAFTLYPLFDIQTTTTHQDTQNHFHYHTLHPDHKYFLSPCFLSVFGMSFLVWFIHSRYISYLIFSQIFVLVNAFGGLSLLIYFILYWEEVEPKVVRVYLVTYFALQSLVAFFLLYHWCSTFPIPKVYSIYFIYIYIYID